MATMFKKHGEGPWVIKWIDAEGRRRERSSRTTCRRSAQRMMAKIVNEVALIREGVVDPQQQRLAREDVRPLTKHIECYIGHLELAGRSQRTVADARRHLDWIISATGASRLSDLSMDAVERALRLLQIVGRSARTLNHRGGSVRAFLGWCVLTQRISSNPLRKLPRQNEDVDRRRERRALTSDEIERLLAVAEQRDRKLWYMVALYAGLRLSELKALRWGDLDLVNGSLVVVGKAKRRDEVPLHPVLLDELRRARPGGVMPSARVFATSPTNDTRRKDFLRAGIVLANDQGLHADLHSLRVTLGTMLARSGVPPQVARRIMRHSRYATTLRYYTHLTRDDSSAAMARLTLAAASAPSPHQFPHQTEHDEVQVHAS